MPKKYHVPIKLHHRGFIPSESMPQLNFGRTVQVAAENALRKNAFMEFSRKIISI